VRQRLLEYLLERPDGVEPADLLSLVFTGQGRDPEFGTRFLDVLLGGDPRFTFDVDARRWHARAHDALCRPIAGQPFVVVDLETTGGGPVSGSITEIGAVRVVDGRVLDTFSTLVNPGRPIQPFVSALTGITDAMVASAPPIGGALPQFLEFAGDAVLVAHNASFDVAHLDAAHRAVTGRALARPSLCTLRLARRLLPELRRGSLDAVAAALGLACYDRHRGLGDARIAAEILCVFLERAAERGVARVSELLALQHAASDGQPFVVHVPRERLAEIPATPGVYHLLGQDGRLLYVGKARRLRARLGNWFSNARGHSRRALELIRQVYDVRVTETGSELAAALLEMRQIRELKPPYNRQGRQLPRVAFLRITVREPFPRLSVTRRLGTDRATYLGPFASSDGAERAQAVLARAFGIRTCPGRLSPSVHVSPCLLGQVGTCPAPCAARIDEPAYRRRVDAFLDFIDGRDDGAVTRLIARRDSAAEELRFEAAARAQRDLLVLEDLRRRRQRLQWILARQNFVVLLPTADRDGAQLYAALGGRLAVELQVRAAADLAAAVHVVRERFARCQDAPLERGEVAASTIMAAWLRDRDREGLILPLDGPDALAQRLDELTVTLHDIRQRGPLPRIDGLA
jgi:DNA polymerase III subunit epsilon